MQLLLDAVLDYLPSPMDIPPVEGIVPGKAERKSVSRSFQSHFRGLIFKLMTDPFVGVLKLYSRLLRYN